MIVSHSNCLILVILEKECSPLAKMKLIDYNKEQFKKKNNYFVINIPSF